MTVFKWLTPISYWLLIVMWSFILVFYVRRFISRKVGSQLFLTLLVILSIDAFRTLFESLYFGAWYTSLVGLLPMDVHDFLVQPQFVFIPKILNVVAAALVIGIVLYKWLPQEEAERNKERQLLERLNSHVVSRENAELELRTLMNRYRAILSSVPDIIMEVDVHKVYTWANDAGEKFFGKEVVGREAQDFFIGEQHTYDVVEPIFGGDDDLTYIESWQRRHDGEKRLLAWWCQGLKNAKGELIGALSTARDITEQKRVQEELRSLKDNLEQEVVEKSKDLSDVQKKLLSAERLATIGELGGHMSHEFKNQLGVMKNVAALLKLKIKDDDPVVARSIRTLEMQIAKTNRTLENILSFARESSQVLTLIDVVEVIRDFVEKAIDAAPETVRIVFDHSVPSYVLPADQVQIVQVLDNLVLNAIEAMDSTGEVRIILEVEEGEVLHLAVSDTGPGITPEVKKRIFEPLFSTKNSGFGFGLAMVARIVEHRGGSIAVDSIPGDGATFHIRIPYGAYALSPDSVV